ncbi:GspE/PulE family protein [Alistipes indistinctus]|uniref:GspE/PulE family protein n=1 Tax=Alistipes indistinctus TaxID=626932 RepID=UPI003F0EA710
MTLPERIPTEIVQLFSSAEAWSYRLVPYARKDGTVLCAGEQGRDYASVSQEIEVLSGFRVQIEPVGPDELSLLLNRYYRREETRPISGRTADLSRIGSGQGFLTDLIGEAFDEYASDIHFEPYEERCRIRLRIDGKLVEKYVLDRSDYASIVNQIKIMANLDISERRLPQDGRILYHRGDRKFDLRVSSLPTIYGEKVVLRLLTRHAELLELSNLGFSERQLADYESAIARPHGMALITGPTGSGKSTTLYATLRRLNRESGNILTIEDPVEYTLEGVNQVQLKEEIGLTFGAALRTFLRQDPDIIMLGEIRDADTAAMAIRSSLTGHLVFSTIHTNSAWGSVSRLRDMGVHPYLLSGTLILCAAQRLVRLLCPDCKKEAELTESEREQVYGPRPVPSDRKEAEDGAGERISEAAIPVDNVDANRTEPFPPADPRDGAGRIPASGRTGPQPAGKTEEAAVGLAGNKTPVSSVARCETMRGESYERMPRQDRTHGHLMQKTEQETSVLPGKQDPEAHSHKHYRPVGCERCYYTGYRGRRAIYEVIPIDDELAEAIRESRPDIAPLLEKRGITTLKDSALDLFLSGQTSLEEVLPLLRE